MRMGLANVDRGFQADVAGRGAYLDFEGARVHRPVPLLRAPVGERGAVYGKLDILCFAGLELHPLEGFQFMGWPIDLRMAVVHIKLNHFRAGALAGVANSDRVDKARLLAGFLFLFLTGETEVAVFERRITQPEPEGELRLDILAVVVTVANVDAFGV